MRKNNPLKMQVGGSHYRKMKQQPVELISSAKLDYYEGTVLSYISRWRWKNGIEDLMKALHTIELRKQLPSDRPHASGAKNMLYNFCRRNGSERVVYEVISAMMDRQNDAAIEILLSYIQHAELDNQIIAKRKEEKC